MSYPWCTSWPTAQARGPRLPGMTAAQTLLLQGTLLLLVLLWDFSASVPAQWKPSEVKEEECTNTTKYYLKDHGLCCSRCPPGYYASERCIPGKDTTCLQCPNNMFTELWNYLPSCFRCLRCDHVLSFEEALPCNLTHRTKCRCIEGTHCITGDTPGRCTHCETDSECPPGTEVSVPGNGISDTVCVPCQPGFYQNASSTFSVCQPITDCRVLGLQIQVPGSDIADSVCIPVPKDEPDYRILIAFLSFLAAFLLSAVIILIGFQRVSLCRKLKNLMNEKPQQLEEATSKDIPSPNSPKDPLLPSKPLRGFLEPKAMHPPLLERETLLNNTFPQKKDIQPDPEGCRKAANVRDPPDTCPESSNSVRDWQEQQVTAGPNSGFQMNGRSMTFNGNIYIYNGTGTGTPECPTSSSLSSPEPPVPMTGELRLISPRQEDGKELHVSVEENWRGLTPFPIQ